MSGFESQARLINRLKKVDHLTTTSEGYGTIGPLDWLAMNTTRGPTADVRVRQAIAYEADKNFILKAIMQGTAIHPDSPFYNSDLETYALDVDLSLIHI